MTTHIIVGSVNFWPTLYLMHCNLLGLWLYILQLYYFVIFLSLHTIKLWIHQTQLKLLPETWRFDLYHRPSSEEAGTQFFRFLTRWEDAVSRKRICMASLIHLVKRSGSLSITVAWDQLMTWFSWVAWSVRADLLCSVKLDARRHLVNVRPSCQELEELSTSFFWWRPLIGSKHQVLGNNFGCVWWI